MDSQGPPSAARRDTRRPVPKRPWFLTTAIIFAWIFGAASCTDGTAVMGIYWSPVPDVTTFAKGAASDADRERIQAAATRCFTALNAGKNRVFPLGAASFVLGAAVVMFAARALGGGSTARSLLVQLVLAQAAFGAVRDSLMSNTALECVDLQRGVVDPTNRSIIDRISPEASRRATIGVAVARLAAAGLIVVGLTRRRSREYYAAVEQLRREAGPP